MNWILLLLALVMIACILCNKLTSKIGSNRCMCGDF